MIEGLLRIYEESRTNPGTPECMFAETLLFNEGWMLRASLKAWLEGRGHTGFGFLPFPLNVMAYSEAQLYTPFRKRAQTDPLGEGHTHVDGIGGHFTIAGSKRGVTLDPGCRYFAAFEAKMYSGRARSPAPTVHRDERARL